MYVTCCCILLSGGSRAGSKLTSTNGDQENDKENTNRHLSPSARSDREAQDLMDQGPQTPLSPVTNTLPHSPGPAPPSPLNGGSVARVGAERTPGTTNNGSIVREPSQTAGRTRRRKGRNRLTVLSTLSEDESEEESEE